MSKTQTYKKSLLNMYESMDATWPLNNIELNQVEVNITYINKYFLNNWATRKQNGWQ